MSVAALKKNRVLIFNAKIVAISMSDMMNLMVGNTLLISGMLITILSDEGDSWLTQNVTTKDKVFFKKSVLEDAIKLGKAENVSDKDE